MATAINPRTTRPVPAVVVAVLAAALGPQPLRAADPWVEATQRRTDAAKSIAFEFQLEETFLPGSVSRHDSPKPNAKPIPAAETRAVSANVLTFDGVKVRYETDHPLWRMPEGELIRKPRLSVANTDYAKAYYAEGIGNDSDRVGYINEQAEAMHVKDIRLLPLALSFRGLDPLVSGYSPRDAQPTGRQKIDGQEYLEYSLARSPSYTVQFLVDPRREHSIRRIRALRLGRVTDQTDVELRNDDRAGWTPARWVRTSYDPTGRVLDTTTAVVSSVRVNTPIPAEQFEISFPEGCRVHDLRTQKRYRALSDGSLREVSPTGADLDATISPPGTPWYVRNRWLIVVSCIGLIAIPALRYGKRKLTPSPA
jgi:hypothetical protein